MSRRYPRTYYLPRGQAYQRALLIVVTVAPVDHVAALHILEEDHVHAERVTHVSYGGCLRHVYDADERMKRLYSEYIVVLRYALYIHYSVFHNSYAGWNIKVNLIPVC